MPGAECRTSTPISLPGEFANPARPQAADPCETVDVVDNHCRVSTEYGFFFRDGVAGGAAYYLCWAQQDSNEDALDRAVRRRLD